jgi:multidrug efflux pump subunit AcrA (membrane-fusion protein)
MSTLRHPVAALSLAAACLFAGCGGSAKHHAEHAGHVASGHEDHEEAEMVAASYVAGCGLRLAPETVQALGVVTARVEATTLTPVDRLTAQIFHAGPPALAIVLVPSADADRLAGGAIEGARRRRIDRGAEATTHRVEWIVELPGDGRKVGDFVELTLTAPPLTTLAVPRSALIEGAEGVFVYVAGGNGFRLTPVETGPADGNRVSITAGLEAGDRVVTNAVETLFLTELRLTKGGGHSH